MSVSARAGDAFPTTGVGIPMLGVTSAGQLTPFVVQTYGDQVETNEVHVPADNTAAVVTYAASAGSAHVIRDIVVSYYGSGTLGNGRVTIADGSDTVFDVDITTKGAYQYTFGTGKRGREGRAMTVTLAAGGAANIQGKLNVSHYAVTVALGGSLDFGNENNSGMYLLIF